MRVYFAPKRVMIIVLFLGLALVAVAYFFSAWRLDAARRARRDDDYGTAERWLAACWYLPGMRSAIALEDALLGVQQGDLRDEKALQSRAAVRSTDRDLILEALAKGNLATFQWDQAQLRADMILQRQPDDARALWLRGRARVEMQQEDLARDDLEHAVKGAPNAFEIRRTWADVLHQLGYVREAIAQYELLLRREPNDEHASLALAHCYEEDARLSAAIELLDDLLVRQPKSVAGLVERGRLALRAGGPPVAETYLRRALELSPDHADANLVMRLALQSLDKVDSEFVARNGRNEQRQAELKSQLQETPHSAHVLTEIGKWAIRTGDGSDAAGWFYSALKEDSAYVPAHEGLAEHFHEVGQPLRAKLHAGLAGSNLVGRTQPSFFAANRSGIVRSVNLELAIEPLVRDRVGTPSLDEASSEEVHSLCAACHAYPEPETFPRSVWRKEVKQGYDFLRDSMLAGDFPSLESVVLYYEARAPQQLPTIAQQIANSAPPVKFEKRGSGWLPNVPLQPGVADANLATLFGGRNKELLLCDTRLNAILVMKPYEPGPGGTVLAQLNCPSHSTVCDLDLDGRQDILVAALGSFFPTDDRMGKVLWLRAGANGQFEAKTLCEGVGRVSDVQVVDFNSDGRLDLIVAAFGWRNTGEILYLENQTQDWTRPEFISRVVDSRHGAIHVPVADLNGDSRPDFLALISQEHEAVVAYLNEGDGVFRQEIVFTAENPAFGCTGMELVDLDGDRDLDVLLTNGDIFDRPYLLKPYHGIQWLENEGAFPYKHHSLVAMYGVSRAVAADFDGDGDQDVAAVSCLPSSLFPQREALRLPSIVLLEQTIKTQFELHVLEEGNCDHFSCTAGDWDNDGQVDMAIANFSWSGSRPIADAAQLWRNAGRP